MPSVRRRCFVHIGPPKTGTSYLQSVLWASQSALSAQGLVLPLGKRDHYHLALALRSIDRPTAADRTATVLQRLSAATDEVGDHDLLITQEQLAPATTAEARRLTELLRPWEVHVVITARDLARQVPSGWQQGIKKRQTDRYEEYLDAVVHHLPAADQFWRHQDLAAVARAWSEAVGPHRVHVVIVPPPGGPQQLLLDRFCSVIGVDPGTLDTSGAVANTSLGHAQAELLRLVNQSLGTALSGPAKSAARAGQQSLAKRVLANQTGPPAKLPTRLHEWCREEARRSVRSLQEGGYDVVGDLEDLMPAFGDGPYPAEVSDAQVLASAVEALAAVVTSHQQALHKLEQQLGDSTGPAALPRSRRRSPADERRQPRATRSG